MNTPQRVVSVLMSCGICRARAKQWCHSKGLYDCDISAAIPISRVQYQVPRSISCRHLQTDIDDALLAILRWPPRQLSYLKKIRFLYVCTCQHQSCRFRLQESLQAATRGYNPTSPALNQVSRPVSRSFHPPTIHF